MAKTLAAQLCGSRAGSWLTSHPGLPETVPVLVPGQPRLVAPASWHGTLSRCEKAPRPSLDHTALSKHTPASHLAPAESRGPGGAEQILSGLQSLAHLSTRCLQGSHTRTPAQHAEEEGLAADFELLLSNEIAFIEFADVPLISRPMAPSLSSSHFIQWSHRKPKGTNPWAGY